MRFQYNALGLRVSKTSTKQTIYFHYDQNRNLIAETDAQGQLIRGYIYLHNTPIAQFTKTNVYYYATDHLGTPQGLLNQAQQWVWRADAGVFGERPKTTKAASPIP